MRKGLFSTDFLIAITIFIVILLLLSPMWDSLNRQVFGREVTRSMQTAAIGAGDILLRTRGSPETWNTTNVKSIGLAENLRMLNITKCKYFFQLLSSNYSDVKFMLGAGAYQLAAEITNKTGEMITYGGVNFTYSTITDNMTEAANSQRIAILKYNETYSEFVNLRIVVWR
ncbi:MAG: hypothetical protein V1835_00755 [Candidatus Micrarchaeota archaeon]